MPRKPVHLIVDCGTCAKRGLEGGEYLSPEDVVTLMFRHPAPMVPLGHLITLRASRCRIELYSLRKPASSRSAAMKAASIAARVLACGGTEVAIVCGDRRYSPLRDYWRDERGIAIYTADTIRQCMFDASPDAFPRVSPNTQSKLVPVDSSTRKIPEQERLQASIFDVLYGGMGRSSVSDGTDDRSDEDRE